MAKIVSLAEVRRIRKAGRSPTPELNEELGRIGGEVLREMALLLLAQPPSPTWKRAVKRPPSPDEAG